MQQLEKIAVPAAQQHSSILTMGTSEEDREVLKRVKDIFKYGFSSYSENRKPPHNRTDEKGLLCSLFLSLLQYYVGVKNQWLLRGAREGKE